MFGANHYLPTGYSTEFICGANAVGRRSTREQMDPANTTCAKCKATEFWQETAAEAGVEYVPAAPAQPAGPCGNPAHKHPRPVHALAA